MPNRKNHKYEGLHEAIRVFSFLSGLGIYFAVVLGICIFLGDRAGALCGAEGAGRVVGILAGFPVALYTMYRHLRDR